MLARAGEYLRVRRDDLRLRLRGAPAGANGLNLDPQLRRPRHGDRLRPGHLDHAEQPGQHCRGERPRRRLTVQVRG